MASRPPPAAGTVPGSSVSLGAGLWSCDGWVVHGSVAVSVLAQPNASNVRLLANEDGHARDLDLPMVEESPWGFTRLG
jgi:hypothetical protein